MTAAVVVALVAALAAMAVIGKPPAKLAALLVALLLIPSTLLFPGAPSGVITASRVVEVAAAVGIGRSLRRGDRQSAPAPPVLFVLLVYLGVTAVTGVALADSRTDTVPAAYLWLDQAEQPLLLVFGLFLGRRLRATTVLRAVAGVTAAAAGIGVVEAITGGSWARLLFRAEPGQLSTSFAGPLELRAGATRVRGAAEFALAYGWVMTALAALLIVAVATMHLHKRRTATTVTTLVLAAAIATVYLTRTRTALAGLIVVAVVEIVRLQARRPFLVAVTAVAAGAALLVIGPSLLNHLSPAVDRGSIDVRVERLPDVLALAAAKPLRGVGFTGISRLGLAGADSSYLRTYVEAGAIAAALLLASVVAAIAAVARGMTRVGDSGARGDDARLALGITLALAALAVSATTYDTFNILGSSRLFWLLCGIGVAAAERTRGPQVLPPLRDLVSAPRATAVAAAVVLGLCILQLAPHRSSEQLVFSTLDVRTEVVSDPGGMGQTFVATTCEAAARIAALGQPWQVTSCHAASSPGWGVMRVQAKTPQALAAAAADVTATLHAIPGLRAATVRPSGRGVTSGRPAAATVAPEVLPITALTAVVVLPRRPRRTRRAPRVT